ncbi:MAG: FGGY family carbohydrate kinase, partial [Pseudomonadota bacterium]
AYNAIRPPFEETGSPRLSGGLNIGAQLYWQFQRDPGLRRRVQHLVTYPQYWGFRLTGVAATDVTSLGCHTDLWNPHAQKPSSLAEGLAVADVLAPTRRPDEILGLLLPEIAGATGLGPDTPVYCGIHDSNASLLPHLLKQNGPFSVVSTGTWVIAMAISGRSVRLDPAQDTLVNVNAFGEPVPSARFMGGREYDLLTQGQDIPPSEDEISEVLGTGTMLLPSIVTDSGPFQGTTACWVSEEPSPGTGQRSAAIGFYLALTTAHCLNLIGAEGPIHVEGPFAKNGSYIQMLGAATSRPIVATTSATGTSEGAAILGSKKMKMARNTAVHDAAIPSRALSKYVASWQTHLAAHLHR